MGRQRTDTTISHLDDTLLTRAMREDRHIRLWVQASRADRPGSYVGPVLDFDHFIVVLGWPSYAAGEPRYIVRKYISMLSLEPRAEDQHR